MRAAASLHVLGTLLSVILLPACSDCDNGEVMPGADAGALDAGEPDSGPFDAGPRASEICVTDLIGRVLTFDALQDGDGSPIRAFGSRTQLLRPRFIAYDPTNDEVYAYNPALAWITVYPAGASGNIAPRRRLDLSGVSEVLALGIDGDHGELYIAREGVIETYARDAEGHASPLRTLPVPLASGGGFAYDPVHGEIYTTGVNGVTVHPRTATAGAASLRNLTLSDAGGAIAVDAVHDEIFVAGQRGNIYSFPRTASGALVTPIRVITGLVEILGLLADPAHDEIVSIGGWSFIFLRTQNGSALPMRTLFVQTTGIALDSARDQFIVSGAAADYAGTPRGRSSLEWYPRLLGDMPPLTPVRAIGNSGYEIESPAGIAIDFTHDELFVSSSFGAGTVLSYPRGATDDAPPLRAVTGREARHTFDLAYDPVTDRIGVVSREPRGEISVFPRTSNGTDLQLDGLHGPLGTTEPWSIAFDSRGQRIYVSPSTTSANPAHSSPAVDVYDNTTGALIARIVGDGPVIVKSEVRYDPRQDMVYVLNDRTVEVYPASADGPTAPIRAMTLASSATAFAYDSAADELYTVVDRGIEVYSGTNTSGAPLRTIAGPATTLYAPSGVAICR